MAHNAMSEQPRLASFQRVFWKSIFRHWRMYALGCLAMLMTSTAEVLVPKFVQWGIDFLAGNGRMDALPSLFRTQDPRASLNILITTLGMVLVMALIGRWGWRQTFGRRTHDEGQELKVKFWNALRWQPLQYFQDKPIGDLMNRAIGDWNKVRFNYGFTFVATLDVIYFVGLALISMLLMDWQLTLLCMVSVPFLPRPIFRLTQREGREHDVAQDSLSALSDLISQTISTVRLQRATASDLVWQQRLAADAQDYAEKSFRVTKTAWQIFPLGVLPTIVAYAVLLTFGLSKVVRGELSIGSFIAMQSYVLLLQGPLFELAQVFAEWQTGMVSFQRMLHIFRDGDDIQAELQTRMVPQEMVNEEQAVVVENLTIAYPGMGERPALQDMSLHIRAGEKLGLLGPIGGGKSTFLKAIAGLLPEYRGSARIFGHEVRSVERGWLTSQITLVPQKPFLFSGTLAYNLCLNQDFSEAQLWEVLEMVSLAHDVRAFPQGLDTWIGEWGINLSGGQKQRLTLARALLRPTPILLIDDGLSAVDGITEEKILGHLQRSFGEQTIVWVSHRMSTLKLCDRIIKLDSGILQLS